MGVRNVKANIFGVWDGVDVNKVYEWLRIGSLLGFIPVVGCVVFLYVMGLTRDIIIPVTPSSYFPPVFLSFTPFGVRLDTTMVYPILTGFTAGIIALKVVSVAVWGILLEYTHFVKIFKDRGYTNPLETLETL